MADKASNSLLAPDLKWAQELKLYRQLGLMGKRVKTGSGGNRRNGGAGGGDTRYNDKGYDGGYRGDGGREYQAREGARGVPEKEYKAHRVTPDLRAGRGGDMRNGCGGSGKGYQDRGYNKGYSGSGNKEYQDRGYSGGGKTVYQEVGGSCSSRSEYNDQSSYGSEYHDKGPTYDVAGYGTGYYKSVDGYGGWGSGQQVFDLDD